MTTTPQDFEAQREAQARAERDKELHIPNFAAVREWIDKLEDWCRDEAEDREKSERVERELREQISDLEEAAADARDAENVLAMVEESLQDIQRGIITFEEFMEEHRRTGIVP